MFSPVKLAQFEDNFLEIGQNVELANRLAEFFSNPEHNYLWDIITTRQTVTTALKDTKAIPLRSNIATGPKNTLEWNEVTVVKDDAFLHIIPVFTEIFKWTYKELNNHCTKIDLGRVFFSKLLPQCKVDLHTDSGKYFDYYDRFHFVVQGNDQNIFYIRDEAILLKPGHLYWINNHVDHHLENNSDIDRINLIIDARLI